MYLKRFNEWLHLIVEIKNALNIGSIIGIFWSRGYFLPRLVSTFNWCLATIFLAMGSFLQEAFFFLLCAEVFGLPTRHLISGSLFEFIYTCFLDKTSYCHLESSCWRGWWGPPKSTIHFWTSSYKCNFWQCSCDTLTLKGHSRPWPR